MTNVGQVSVGLGLDDAKFKKGLSDAEKQTKQFASLMQKSLAGIAAGFTLIPAVFLIIGLLIVTFGYHLTDDKIAECSAEIAKRKQQA